MRLSSTLRVKVLFADAAAWTGGRPMASSAAIRAIKYLALRGERVSRLPARTSANGHCACITDRADRIGQRRAVLVLFLAEAGLPVAATLAVSVTGRIVSTGQTALRTTASVTLPKNMCGIVPRPCVAITTRSALKSRAKARMVFGTSDWNTIRV